MSVNINKTSENYLESEIPTKFGKVFLSLN